MELVAFLGTDTENWGQVTALIKHGQFDKVLLVKNKDAEKFPQTENTTVVEFDTSKPISEITAAMKEKLTSKLNTEFEVALSLASGSGKEHMALIAALLNIPVGIRLVVFTKAGVDFIT